MMEPLCITAHLSSPITIGRKEDIALDGILSYEVLRRHYGADFYTLPDPKEQLCFARLPLEMRGRPSPLIVGLDTGAVWMRPSQGVRDESLWYWAVSSAIFEVKGRDCQYWNKQIAEQMTDSIDFCGRRGKIIIEQSRYKSYHMPRTRIATPEISWYAFGNREAIAALLAPVCAIGKKSAYGDGAMLRWEVTVIDGDYSEWRDDHLMRPLPGPLARGIQWSEPPDLHFIAYRAPQWHPLNQAMCAVGGLRAPQETQG